jgi:hypothetical protein
MNIFVLEYDTTNDKVSIGCKITLFSCFSPLSFDISWRLFATAGNQEVFTDSGVHVSCNHSYIKFRDCLIDPV